MLIHIRVALSVVVLWSIPARRNQWCSHSAEARRILFKKGSHEVELRAHNSSATYSEIPESRVPTEVEVTFGSDHLNAIIKGILMPWLDNLFSELKLPDIAILAGQSLNNLAIHNLELADVHVLPYRGRPATLRPEDFVTGITLAARASATASALLGSKGGSMINVDIEDDVQLDLAVSRLPGDVVKLSITRLELQHSKSGKKDMKTVNENLWSAVRGLVAEAPGVKHGILAAVGHFVNVWGKNPKLNFPLDVLLGIPLGPSGGCIGSDFSHDGTLVMSMRQSKQMCRALMDVKVKHLEISTDMSVHASVSLEPWVEVTQMRATHSDDHVQQLADEWVGPIYSGKPMPYQSIDGRSKPKKNYKDALDQCVRDGAIGECGSVFGEVNADGKLEYSVGRTTFPLPDGEDQWIKCADEGQVCHFTDDESQWGDPQKDDYQIYDINAHGGRTEPKRFLRLRFGEFKTPTDFVERTWFDDGRGIPCRKDNFGKGLQYEGQTGFKNAYCKRLIFRHDDNPEGTQCTKPECLFNGYCADQGVYCPLERPCVLLSPGTDFPIPEFTANHFPAGMRSSEGCIAEEVDSTTGERFCPTSPPSKHCWSKRNGSVTAFTQPVKVVARARRSCDGPYHLPCWGDITPAEPPPPLHFDGIGSSDFSFSLPTALLNSALAAVYSAGLIRGAAFKIPEVDTVGKLCDVSKGYLCLTSMYGGEVKRDTEIRLSLQMTAPGKVALDGGRLLVSLGMELQVHAVMESNLGKSVESMMVSKKKCIRKEGVLQVSKSKSGENSKPHWVELKRNTLKTFAVFGRAPIRAQAIGSQIGYWSVEPVADNPKCFSMKQSLKSTYYFCSESPETTKEWVELMTNKLDVKCKRKRGKAELAQLQFGLQAHAGVVVEKSKYLCVRPTVEDQDLFAYVGQLKTKNATSAATVKGLGHRSLLNFVIRKFGLLKPMQLWNLQTLTPGAGMKNDPPPRIEIDKNRILVTGQAAYSKKEHTDTEGGENEELLESEGGFEFNAGKDNPCMRDSDKVPGSSSGVGSAIMAPMKMVLLAPAKATKKAIEYTRRKTMKRKAK